jgi:hypothetical protein
MSTTYHFQHQCLQYWWIKHFRLLLNWLRRESHNRLDSDGSPTTDLIPTGVPQPTWFRRESYNRLHSDGSPTTDFIPTGVPQPTWFRRESHNRRYRENALQTMKCNTYFPIFSSMDMTGHDFDGTTSTVHHFLHRWFSIISADWLLCLSHCIIFGFFRPRQTQMNHQILFHHCFPSEQVHWCSRHEQPLTICH